VAETSSGAERPLPDYARGSASPIWLPTFDGVRGIAVATIVLFHLVHASVGGTPYSPSFAPAYAWLWSIYFWVDIFFVLSGMVMFLPVAVNGTLGDWRAYAIRRVARILPLYWFVIVVLIAIFPLLYGNVHQVPAAGGMLVDLPRPDLGSIALHLTFLEPIVDPTAVGWGINGAIWTLSIDAIFYTLLPFLAGAYLRRPLLGLGAAIAISALWRTHALDIDPFALRQFPLFAVDFAIGMTLAWAIVRTLRSDHAERLRRVGPWLCLAALAAWLGAMYKVGIDNRPLVLFLSSWPVATAIPLLFAAFAFTTVFLPPKLQWPLTNRVTSFVAEISYPLYILHGIVLVLVARAVKFRFDLDPLRKVGFILLVFACSLLVAWIVHKLVERPARQLGKRFARRFDDRRRASDEREAPPAVEPEPEPAPGSAG
jgi:peptidoglycan/LPS O-acetylase OafA/YrhL